MLEWEKLKLPTAERAAPVGLRTKFRTISFARRVGKTELNRLVRKNNSARKVWPLQ